MCSSRFKSNNWASEPKILYFTYMVYNIYGTVYNI